MSYTRFNFILLTRKYSRKNFCEKEQNPKFSLTSIIDRKNFCEKGPWYIRIVYISYVRLACNYVVYTTQLFSVITGMSRVVCTIQFSRMYDLYTSYVRLTYSYVVYITYLFRINDLITDMSWVVCTTQLSRLHDLCSLFISYTRTIQLSRIYGLFILYVLFNYWYH